MSAVELMVEGTNTLMVAEPEVYRNGSTHQTLELNGKAASNGKVLIIDSDLLQVLIRTTAGGRVNFDRAIARRRPFITALDQDLTDLNITYGNQRPVRGSIRNEDFPQYMAKRTPLMEARKQLSAAQARDKLTLRELIKEGVFK